MAENVLAVLCADLHFSLKPPVARSVETDWLNTQAEYWDQVENIAFKHKVPVIIAGDIFDRWNSPPELVNAVIRWFRRRSPKYAVAGNHDLPPGGVADISKSSYRTLCEAGAITDLSLANCAVDLVKSGLQIYPYPHGMSLDSLETESAPWGVRLAVVHHYAWFHRQDGYTGAQTKDRIPVLAHNFKDVDVVLWGDNHKTVPPTEFGMTTHFNPGSFMRRKSDEVNHRPCVGLLTADKGVVVYYLNTDGDRWADLDKMPVSAATADLMSDESMLNALKLDFIKLGESALDFQEAVKKAIRDKGLVGSDEEKVINRWMEEGVC